MTVDMVNCVPLWIGCDAEECILKALKDGGVEIHKPSILGGGYDVYRLAAKGRRESKKNVRQAFQRVGEAARRLYELKGDARPAAAAAGSPGRDGPPAGAATAPPAAPAAAVAGGRPGAPCAGRPLIAAAIGAAARRRPPAGGA